MFSYDWDWSVIWHYRQAFIEGLGTTFALSILSIVSGTVAGLGLGTVLSVKTEFLRPVNGLLLFLVDGVKALPPLILLLVFYYWLPFLLGIESEFWLAVSALGLSLSAFVADVFRHSIEGVPRPLIEACYALGMDRRTVLQRLVVPEALRSIVPTMGLLFLDIFKLSSLASVISVAELVHRASEVSTYTFRFLEVYAALAAIYLALLLPFSRFVRRLEVAPMFVRRS